MQYNKNTKKEDKKSVTDDILQIYEGTCAYKWIRNLNNNKTEQEPKTETAEIKLLRRAADYTRKDQIRNTKIWRGLAFFDLKNKILKCRSQ